MTLVVRTPRSYEQERQYVLGVVLDDWWHVQWRHEPQSRDDVEIVDLADPDGAAVVLPDTLFSTPGDRWLTPRTVPAPPYPRVYARAGPSASTTEIPLVFGCSETARASGAVEKTGRRTLLRLDVFGLAFFMLTRYEELALGTTDDLGRFPDEASVAHRGGFRAVPIVDVYVDLLWQVLSASWPRLSRRNSRYEIRVTHDVDNPLSSGGGGTARLRPLLGDLALRRDPLLALRRARALMSSGEAGRVADPNNTFDFLMSVSERHHLRSAFYFLAHNGGPEERDRWRWFDDPWVEELIARVGRRGHEVGFHAARGTHLDQGRTVEEFDRLARLVGRAGVRQQRWGGRQHYLQWQNPSTWRNWEAAGLDYDATVGFSGAAGFRTGTCHEFRVFDLLDRRRLDLVEVPFQAMDVALLGSASGGSARRAAHSAIMEVARQCRRHRGVLGLLWHNDSRLRTQREKNWYASLISDLTTS